MFEEGERHFNWKGPLVGYKGLHKWINSHLPKPELCQICNQKKLLAAACVTHVYTRDFKNWKYVCWSCHATLDGYNKGKSIGRIWPEEQRQKLSLHHKQSGKFAGKNNAMYGLTGEKNPFYGKKHTEANKQKMRLAQIERRRRETSSTLEHS